MSSFCCLNLGCKENILEGVSISSYIERHGWTQIDDYRIADLIVINSCGLQKRHEDSMKSAYSDILRTKKSSGRIVFAGCLPAINKTALKDINYDGPIISPRDYTQLSEFLGETAESTNAPWDYLSVEWGNPIFDKSVLGTLYRFCKRLIGLAPWFPIPRWLWQVLVMGSKRTPAIRIAIGCTGECAYCAIRIAKGRVTSISHDRIVKTVRTLADKKPDFIALSADDTASYGADGGIRLPALLQILLTTTPQTKYILRNLEPDGVYSAFDEMKKVFSSHSIVYAILPLQSASDTVLARMKRKYTFNQYQRIATMIRKISPMTILRSHLMVGFPGETTGDFLKSCAAVLILPVDHWELFAFSAREHTPAAAMQGNVPERIRLLRKRILSVVTILGYCNPTRWLPLKTGISLRRDLPSVFECPAAS
jgi:tRNA A37 methylthiotransferase MiaB